VTHIALHFSTPEVLDGIKPVHLLGSIWKPNIR